MSTSFVVPTPDAVKSLLSMIFGEDLGVNGADSGNLDDQHVATFIDDQDQLVALCACDKAFVAYSGAALSMIPADVAKEMIASGDITEAIVGNFYEVMNICSKLMMSDSSDHLRLRETVDTEQAAAMISQLNGSAEVRGFDIDIPRYGTGRLTFLIS